MFDRFRLRKFFILSVLVFGTLWAQSLLAAIVTQESAFVFTEPSFDSEVLTNLAKGKKISVSKKIYGNYGKFYKVKLQEGIGYIAIIDVDVKASGGAENVSDKKKKKRKKKAKKKKKRKKKAKNKKKRRKKTANKKRKKKKKSARSRDRDDDDFDDDDDDDLRDDDRDNSGDIFADEKDFSKPDVDGEPPIYFMNMMGGFAGYYNYQEDINGLDAKANLPIVGFRITGPDFLISGPVLDFNVALSFGAPKYLQDVAANSPSGFAVFADLSIVFPIKQAGKNLFYASVGPLIHYSTYSLVVVPIGGTVDDAVNFDLQEAKVGGVLGVGYGRRFGRLIGKIDGRFYLERKSYLGVNISLQYHYK